MFLHLPSEHLEEMIRAAVVCVVSVLAPSSHMEKYRWRYIDGGRESKREGKPVIVYSLGRGWMSAVTIPPCLGNICSGAPANRFTSPIPPPKAAGKCASSICTLAIQRLEVHCVFRKDENSQEVRTQSSAGMRGIPIASQSLAFGGPALL